MLEGTKSSPKLHYFNGHDPKEQNRGMLMLTNAIVEEMPDKFTFQIVNEDQQEGGEPIRWVLRAESNEDMQAWINTVTKAAAIRKVVRVKDQQDAADGGAFDSGGGGGGVAKPKGSAAVLQKVFGQDAGVKAAQELQKANIVKLPKMPTSAKIPGRISESEQLRIDITRQLVPSYFNIVRRNLTDGIPKAIMLCLVNEVKEQMQNALLDVLYKRDDSGQNKVEKLLEEDADFTRQKTRCQEFLRLLDEAAATVREVQDFRT